MTEQKQDPTEFTPSFKAEGDASSTVASGRNVAGEDTQEVAEVGKPLMLERRDIVPGHLEAGGTEIVFQRHGKYIRDREDSHVGGLTEQAVQLETEAADRYFTDLLESMSDEEKAKTYFLFVASDTSYAGAGQRSYETATIAQKVAETILKEQGVPEDNVVNLSHKLDTQGSPRPMARLREPQMFDKSPDFVKYMSEKYGGMGMDFWIAFEEDVEKEVREGMKAEGPDEIADRMKLTAKVIARYASMFHASHPDSRLVVWAGTHYDTISPFVKRDVLHKPKREAVLVDYGGGFTLDIDANKVATAKISGKDYPVSL